MTIQRALGQPKDRRRLIHRQSAEITQEDDLSLKRITLFEFLERLVNREHIVRGRLQHSACLVEFPAPPTPTALWPGFATRLFDQNVAHGPRGGEEDMLPPLPGHFTISCNSQVGFVDQRRWLKSLAGRLPGQPGPRELVQLGINQRQEVRRGLAVPGLRRSEHRGRRRVA